MTEAAGVRRAAIDLNVDLGEGLGVWRLGDDLALLDVISSANVACGFHAGDPTIMRETCRRAHERGVRVGAHVGYRDIEGFGRRDLALEADAVTDAVVYQLGALRACAESVGTTVSHLKAHGALYHRAHRDEDCAVAIADAIVAVDARLVVLAAPGSLLLAAASERGLLTRCEGFVDRGYAPDGTLIARGRSGSMLERDSAVDQALSLARDGCVRLADGSTLSHRVDSLCVHGDSPGAVAMALGVREALRSGGIAVEPFA